MEEFCRVLQGLMSPDNTVRGAAEAYFVDQAEKNLSSVVQMLLQLLSTGSADFTLRSFSGILLRQVIERKNKLFDHQINSQIKIGLLNLWACESHPILMKRVAHSLAQLAAVDDWAELLPCVITTSSGKSPSHLIAVLNLIEILMRYSPACVLRSIDKVGGFLGTFMSSESPLVQIACARATCACIVGLEDEDAKNAFRPAIQPIVNVLGDALGRGDEADAITIMENLAEIAQDQPIFFKGFVDVVVSAMQTIAKAEALEFSTRTMALELMVTLAETAPALARRCTGLTQGIVPLCMEFMLLFEDTEREWVSGRYTTEPIEGDWTVGEQCLERVTAGLGPRVVAPPLLQLVEQFCARSEFTFRRASVAALARLAEGCAKQFAKLYLPTSKAFLVQFLADPSQVVRFEAIQTIGRFATLFPEDVPNLVSQFVPPLVSHLGDVGNCERVRGHAASALSSLLNPEVCEASSLQPHLDVTLQALASTLQTTSILVQSPCLDLLGCVAQVSADSFLPYYASFMPGIKSILVSAASPDQGVVRGKAMECAGLIGDAVGVDVFASDALELMNLFIHFLETDKDCDVTFEYVLPACARIAKAVGPRFEPFLPLIMTPLLVGATQVIQFSMEDAGEDDTVGEVVHNEDTGTDSAVVELPGGLKKRISLNTHAVEQKNKAARLLYEFAKSMKGHLKSFLVPSLQALLPMITDKNSSDIRSSASLALSPMFSATLHAAANGFLPRDCLPEVLSACLAKILESLRGEVNPTSRACAAECLKDILQACRESGAATVDGNFQDPMCTVELTIAGAIVDELLTHCGDSVQRYRRQEASFHSNEGLEEEDKEGLAEILEEEEDLLTNLVDAMGMLLKLVGPSLMPVFNKFISPVFAPFLAPTQPLSLQAITVCLLDDVIEFGGESAKVYVGPALPVFLRNIQSEHQVLRQSSMYGIAQSIRFAPEVACPLVGTLVPTLVNYLQSAVAKEEEYEGTTENAIFSLGLICNSSQFRAESWGGVDAQLVASMWLAGLPLRADEAEAKTASMQLCDCIERGDTLIVGENYRNLSVLLRIIADVFIEATDTSTAPVESDEQPFSLAHTATLSRMQLIVRQLLGAGGLPADLVHSSILPLSAQQQQALQRSI